MKSAPHYYLSLLGLLLGLIGSLLLAISFGASPSNFRITNEPDGGAIICINGQGLFRASASEKHNTFTMGLPCPEWDKAKPIAMVYVDKPNAALWGIGFLVFSFFLQVITLRKPEGATITVIKHSYGPRQRSPKSN